MHQLIDGARRSGGSADSADVQDPSTGELLERVRLASAADVDAAVQAARRAFPAWSRTTPAERAEVLSRTAQLLADRAEDFAAVESRQAGTLDGRATAEYSPDHTSSIRREAVGVVGSIAPWNYPLQMAGWKVLPAVAAGNTVVLKPSELTPLTALMLAEVAQEAGLPAGVFNVVTGTGAEAGACLVSHPGVDLVSFTGSTAVGRSVLVAAAATVKRVHMELGGKAPFVVFDDADLEAAARGAVAGSLINAGQDCTAATRAYVQAPLHDAFVARVAELMADVRLGPTDDPATDLGPLVSRRQQQRVAGMVDRAVADGATLVRGGRAPGGELSRGSYYEPTLLVGADQRSEVVQTEVFGPVLVVLLFDSDEQGLALANDSPFGLAASAWTTSVYRALTATRELRAGTVWVNDHIPIVSDMPHGGFGQSGYGKDMSQYALDDYTQVKHVMYDGTGLAAKPWHSTVFTG